MGIDGAVVAKEVVSPDVGKKLVSGQCDILILNQVEEKVVFLRGQVDPFTVYGNGAGGKVHFQSVELHYLGAVVLGTALPLQDRIHPSHQFLRAEWLDHIIVDAQLEAEQLVVFFPSGGEHDYRDVLDLLNFLHRAESIQLRHHHIHDNQIVIVELAETDGTHAVGCFGHLISAELSVFLDDLPNLIFVVYYE